MASPLQFAYRTQKTIGVFDAAPVYTPLAGFTKPEGNLRCSAYSPCGRFFGWASPESVTVVDTSTGHQVLNLPIANVYELGFSPLGTFVITWERPAKDEAGDATKNLKVWRTVEEGVAASDKQPLGRFVQKQQGAGTSSTQPTKSTAPVSSPTRSSSTRATTSSRSGTSSASRGPQTLPSRPGLRTMLWPSLCLSARANRPSSRSSTSPCSRTPFPRRPSSRGDKVQLKWNKRGSSILVLAQTDVDRSGKSYYGETTLYLLSTNGAFDARVTLDKEGPIHDVSWSPNSREFGVVYGYMPAKATIFNDRAVAKHSFPLSPRNTITFSPSGRFVLVAGFGNLAGQIDVYDLEKDYRKVCTIESGNPSVCEWSPDSRYIMTATTSPRLRVDNGVKLWHVGGTIMYNEDMVELYNVVWRPAAPENVAGGDPLSPVPSPHESATAYLGTVKTPSKPAGAYRPPVPAASPRLCISSERTRAAPLTFARCGAGRGTRAGRGVPGAEPADNDGASKRNKKKRGKKGNQEGKPEAEPNGGASLAPPPHERGPGSGGERRSPERRGPANGNGRDLRSRSRNNGNRSRSNTQQDPRGHPGAQGNATPPPAGQGANAVADASQNPNAKKVRSLQKKIRAIEDLEMRLAGGEKLEDTQLKKIQTKSTVLKELEVLERE
ncbi:hypothetical protein ACCO45_013984 [Purpureocillium lilacinum]|uniref:Uncharacterized protein n=1 Tax=Purpureocillium lilacinum TaxID=33203 RepID=A0ACC4D7E2_PURLI